MKSAPLILIAPSTQRKGVEFADASISLSNRYSQAILDAGGLPLILPCAPDPELTREYVRRSAGVVLTGGDDVQMKLVGRRVSPAVAATVSEPEPERDILELELVDEVFKQGKPLLGICRGHQLINIALGGTLVVDIPLELPEAINHRRMDSKCDPVHDVTLPDDSQLAAILESTRVAVNSTHHQSVGRVAGPLRVSARSEDGVVEALELKDPRQLPFLLTVQFHPERLYDRYPVFQKLFAEFIRACRPNQSKKS
jgi:putative glutamine amidotransferase